MKHFNTLKKGTITIVAMAIYSFSAKAQLANPTGTIGLTAVNGSLTTGLRSDGAPPLSQAIVPTWTGIHTFNNGTYSALFTGGSVGIGTSTPTTLLQVGGSVFFKNAPTAGMDGFLYVNGTLPNSSNAFGDWCGIYNNVSVPSGANFNYSGFYSNLGDNSTGGAHEFEAITSICRAICTETTYRYRFSNNSDPHASTGTQSLSIGASTTGVNFGTYNGAWNSAFANVGSADVAITDNSSTNGANVGVIGVALNGSSGTQNAGYFALSTSDPSYESAALLADNGSTTSPIFRARVAGTTKDVIDASGNLGIGTTSPGQLVEIKSGNLLLSNAGTAGQLQFQGTSSGISTFKAGAQGSTNINYVLPTAQGAASTFLSKMMVVVIYLGLQALLDRQAQQVVLEVPDGY